MELSNDTHVRKTVVDVDPFYPINVNEFIVSLPKDLNDAESHEYRKFHVCGNCFGFSSTIINEYMGRGKLITPDRVSSMKIIAQ